MLYLFFTSILHKVLAVETPILTLEAPTPQNGQINANNSLNVTDNLSVFDYFEGLTFQEIMLSGNLENTKRMQRD